MVNLNSVAMFFHTTFGTFEIGNLTCAKNTGSCSYKGPFTPCKRECKSKTTVAW